MAAKIKFFIRIAKSKTINSNDANIRVRFSNGRQFDLTALSNFQINPDFWNNDKGVVRQRAEFADSKYLQNKLDDLASLIKKEFQNTPDNSNINNEWLTDAIDKFSNPDKYLQENTNLFGFIQHFIKNSDKRVNPDTGNPVTYKMKREYEVTFKYLKEYAIEYGEPDFVDIDLEFYQRFIDFLRNYKIEMKDKTIKNLSNNTIGKKIQTLKIFLNAATEQGINHYQKYKSRSFKAISEESDNIYLTKEELTKFYEYDFSNKPYLERVRDLFIVASWTGVRFSDLQQITPDKIKDDFIRLKQKKTSNKVVIPVHKTVRDILNKYNGKLPKPISNQKYNEYLKEAARIAEIKSIFIKTVSLKGLKVEKRYPKHELICSHSARRSFCTNAYKDNIPTLAIMAISGHRTEKAFLKYIKADGEEHANKVLQMWQRNGEFMSVAK
jgi:integrase